MSRATDKARARFLALVEQRESDIDRLAREMADALKGLTPAEIREVVGSISAQEASRFTTALQSAMQAAQRQGAFIGARVATMGDRAAAKWLSRNRETVGARFSARIHQQGREMTRDLLETVATVVREGKSATEAARRIRDVLGHEPATEISQIASDAATAARRMVSAVGDPEAAAAYQRKIASLRGYGARLGRMHSTSGQLAYGMRSSAQALALELQRAVEAGRDDLIDRAVYYHGYDRRAYHQRMTARTEMSRAYNEAFVATSSAEPWVIGYRWVLGPRHPKRDICDVFAGQNLYGLGPGVYPSGKQPDNPAHPNCMCGWEDVIDKLIGVDDERPPAPPAQDGATAEWLATQPASVQAEILGPTQARAFAETGRLGGSLLEAATTPPARE